MPAPKKINNMRRKTNKKRKIKTIRHRSRHMICRRVRQSGGIKLADNFTDQIGSKIQTNLKSDLIPGETCTIYTSGPSAANIKCQTKTRENSRSRAISGEFVGNKFTGHGIFDWIDDPYYQRYEGVWVNNKIHGDGIMKWRDKVFTGMFENDKPIHGKVSYLAGKIAIKGELQVDAAEIGRMIKIGERPEPLWGSRPVIGYDGDILEGTPHGKGTVFFVDGCLYEGDINKGTMHGKGIYTTYIDDDGPDEIIEGNWKIGVLDGTTYEWYKNTDKVLNRVYVNGNLNQTKEVNSNSNHTEMAEAFKYVTNSTIKIRLQEILDIIHGIDRKREIIKEFGEIQKNYRFKYSPKNLDTGSTPILTPPRRVRGQVIGTSMVGWMKNKPQADALYEYMRTKPSPVSSPDVSPRSSPDTP